MNWNYMEQSEGGDYSYYRGAPFQKGYGFGGEYFANFLVGLCL